MLLTGATVTQTAKTLGVSRQTVSDWRNHGEVFREVYNERRLESKEATSNRLSSLGQKAIEVLERELDGPKSLEAARFVIRAAESYGNHDLRDARFQEMARSAVIKELLDAFELMSKTGRENFESLMQICRNNGYNPFNPFGETGSPSA